jgi:TatD DNase family protein
MEMFFDSHCHLTAEVLASQLDDVLQRARAAGVTRILNIGDSLASSRAALGQISLAKNHGIEMFVTAGVHPQNALQFDERSVGVLRALAEDKSVVAIGEIGLDFVYDDSHEKFPGATRAVQEEVLRAQLELARERGLPVVIHNREADDALLRVLREYSGLRGVFHCFGSSLEVARQVLDLGFYLGFTGLITFKNADAVREVAKLCPLDRTLIETDAPYLAPVPHRGKTNEPAFVPRVAEQLAQLHGSTLEAIAERTTRNAQRLFAPTP